MDNLYNFTRKYPIFKKLSILTKNNLSEPQILLLFILLTIILILLLPIGQIISNILIFVILIENKKLEEFIIFAILMIFDPLKSIIPFFNIFKLIFIALFLFNQPCRENVLKILNLLEIRISELKGFSLRDRAMHAVNQVKDQVNEKVNEKGVKEIKESVKEGFNRIKELNKDKSE